MTDPNVLLIVMDSVRADNLSLYGHEHETTPFLEEFSEGATTYEQGRSPGTWSLPSHTSIFTGKHVVEHGIRRVSHKLRPGYTIWEELGQEGYETGVFSENTWITDMDVGLKDVFDRVEGARNLPYPDAIDPTNFVLSEGQGQYLQFLKRCLSADHPVQSVMNGAVTKLAWDYPYLLPDRFSATTPADVYTDLFLDWSGQLDGPWAACINYMDGHLPYEPSTEHDQWGGETLRDLQSEMKDQVWEFNGGDRPWWQRRALEGVYDGTIHQMDSEIDRLVSALEDRGDLEDTLVVVTSDHGEGFGEPSRVRPGARVTAHGAGIHECLLHVPLVVKYPGQDRQVTVEEPASLTRFPDVVRSAVDGEWEIGTEFVPEGPVYASSHGLEEPMEERALKYVDDLWRFNGDALAVYEEESAGVRKRISWRREYGAEVTSVRATESYVSDGEFDPTPVNELFDALPDIGMKEDSEGEIDESTQKQLEDLGYM